MARQTRNCMGLLSLFHASSQFVLCTLVIITFQFQIVATAIADSREYTQQIQPLLKKFCFDCHSEKLSEADINLEAFQSTEELRADLNVWLKTRRMLESEQMPPPEATQLSEPERQLLLTWLRNFLTREAAARAGDPGPVILRRLNNEEYNYTIRDLTGITSLNPTREFPVDGAAGEGFINTGGAQSMSPSFVTKYLDAGKEVASHLVLLPDGITFSAGTSRRDWTDERIAAIQRFYDKYTVSKEVFVDVGGTGKVANEGGAIPVVSYFKALLEEREALTSGEKSIEALARSRNLNRKYLQKLWDTFAVTSDPESILLDHLRGMWEKASSEDCSALAAEVERLQQQLWKFNSIGQLTDGGKQKLWMEPHNPFTTRQDFRFPLPAPSGENRTTVVLSTSEVFGREDASYVIWERPRLEFKPEASGALHPPVLLKDLYRNEPFVEKFIKAELPRTAEYLSAVAQLPHQNHTLADLAKASNLNVELLQRWAVITSFDSSTDRTIRNHFQDRIANAHGYTSIHGWGHAGMPSLLANQSNEDVRFLTLTVPKQSIVVHPSPELDAIVSWQSPVAADIRLSTSIIDTDAVCGNGASCRIEHLAESGTTVLAESLFDNGGRSVLKVDERISVKPGDVISVIVSAKDRNHSCDSTQVVFQISEVEGEKRTWDLSSDVVSRIRDANPLSDSYDHPEVWHFHSRSPDRNSFFPPGTILAEWRNAVRDGRAAEELAQLVQNLLTQTKEEQWNEADLELRNSLLSWTGPLRWYLITAVHKNEPATNVQQQALKFGVHPDGTAISPDSLCVRASQNLSLSLPHSFASEAEFVTSAVLHDASSGGGCVQAAVGLKVLTPNEFSPAQPILIGTSPETQTRVARAFDDFRDLFPAAVCYSRIVPVDEVVTLTLYFREDDHFQRLMLDDKEAAELNHLWDELLYVAQEPLALTVAFEQIYEFATQDRPDLVNAFEPMRDPINKRGEEFRRRLLQTEPAHLDALLKFAHRAWRRPLKDAEESELRSLYKTLRQAELSHEAAIRLVLARVLTAPAFLYRLEQTYPGSDATPVSQNELATRLSYFLWSSLPDDELRQAVETGQLENETVLIQQTERMLDDPRTRRLAIQFACQWLHLRDFDQNNDKNESLYPEFSQLRDEMYEETVRFFEHMFRNNGSILDLLDADHTFLNEALAEHYGLDGVEGDEWKLVGNLKARGRGGVLGMAAFLASQSGASRTSPILRGNWIYETLLGERLPRPPANVPQLPDAVPDGLTARQLIEKHSSEPGCARCHRKIDHYGFALEQFDAIGRTRSFEVDTKTELENGVPLEGLDGLRQYLLTDRRDDVVRQFCRKLLGFALGREVQLSDEVLLDEMLLQLKENHYRFQIAVEVIVKSDQFRKIRGRDFQSNAPQAGVSADAQ